MNRLYFHYWMEQPSQIREHLKKVFNITRTGITEIRDQTLITDGITNTDLEAVTQEKMEAYVGSKETFPRLWELSCAKARFEVQPPTVEVKGTLNVLTDKPIKQNDNQEIKTSKKENNKEGESLQGASSGTDEVPGKGKASQGSSTKGIS